MSLRYNAEKVRQALTYIAANLPEAGNMYKVLKVMYFADKCHLRRYGRTIFGDRYLAMKHGPVPWGAYRKVSSERDNWGIVKKEPLYKVEKDNTIVPLINPDLDFFSESDLKCLNEEIAACRNLSFSQLKRRSHDEAYKAVGEEDEMTIESIASAAATTPEERQLLLEHLSEA